MSARPGHRVTVQGGTAEAARVAAGRRVHVVNSLGHQVADTWAVALPDGVRTLSMSHTRLAMGRISPGVGDVLVDEQRQPMLVVLSDTSAGGHDTLIPACDPQRYRDLGFEGPHASCSANFLAAMGDHGMRPGRVPDPLNLFMAVPVARDGSLSLEPSRAEIGSEIVFEALQDLLLVVSACPQDLVPINGSAGTPRQIDVYTN